MLEAARPHCREPGWPLPIASATESTNAWRSGGISLIYQLSSGDEQRVASRQNKVKVAIALPHHRLEDLYFNYLTKSSADTPNTLVGGGFLPRDRDMYLTKACGVTWE
jgi:hypothetical protein